MLGNPVPEQPTILVIAGELSGDLHTAKLMREIKALDPNVKFWGIGGDAMAAEGAELLYHVKDMAVLGLTEVLKRYGFFRRVFHHMLAEADSRQPDAVLLVDYPGFNLRFAKQAKKRGHRILYYICPQVWAWKSSRIPKMAACIDRLFVLFPFEVDIFKDTNLKTQFVGHPLVEELQHVRETPVADRPELPWPARTTTSDPTEAEKPGPPPFRLALLPGSREQEIRRILPALLHAVKPLAADGTIAPVIAAADQRFLSIISEQQTDAGTDLPVNVCQARHLLWAADGALVASGTATLEAGLLKCPMVIVYKTAGLTYAIGKRVVKLPYIGLVNIVLGKKEFPELIQKEAIPEAIRTTCSEFLLHNEKNRAARTECHRLENLLSGQEAESGVILAREVLTELRSR